MDMAEALRAAGHYLATSARLGTRAGRALCRQTSVPVRCQNKRI